MRRLALVLALVSVMVWLSLPQALFAASTAYITITAQGSEIDITCNTTAWDVGTVSNSDNVNCGTAYARITNNTSESVDITIHGHDMKSTDNLTTWTLSDNGTNSTGAAVFGMEAALSGGSYDVTIRKTAAFETLKAGLASLGTQDFGMCFVAPVAGYVGNKTMEMVGETDSNVETPRGVCLTASLSP